jgi:hypothetical protein
MKKLFGAIALTVAAASMAFGTTTIAKWQGDAKGAFAMYYDDGCYSAMTYATTTLKKYNIPGTFYLCIGWIAHKPDVVKQWCDMADNKIIFLGNHTYNHNGVENYEKAIEEIGKNDKVIREGIGLGPKGLISFAQPGVVTWNITPEQEKNDIFVKFPSIRRPTINKFGIENVGARTHKTAADFIPTLDKIEEHGIFDSVIFHGIGGDWFNFPADEHEKLCEELVRRKLKGTLWTDATINIQKYIAERDGATVKVVSDFNEKGQAELELTVTTDPESYDTPLTLVTTVPEGDWKGCRIYQDKTVTAVPNYNGVVKYNVVPKSGTIKLELIK